MAFPSWTALVGVALAIAVFTAGLGLSRGLERDPAQLRPLWRERDVVLLLLLIALALVLRLIGLGSRPIDNDEPVGLPLASLEAWAREADARLHPPLSSLFMAWAARAEGLTGAREVSVLAGVLTVIVAFAAARRAGRGAALVAGAWVAVAPAALHPAQLARGYALLALFVLASHVALRRALADGRARSWLVYGACAALALGSEYLALLPLVTEAALALLHCRPFARVRLAGALGGAACLVAFVVPFAWQTPQLGPGGGPHAPTGIARALLEGSLLLSGSANVLGAVLGAVLIAVAARRGVLARADQRLALAALVAFAAPVAAAAWHGVRARYLLHVFPMFAVLVSVAAFRIGHALGPWLAAALAAGHVALLPAYYAGRMPSSELGTGTRTPAVYGLLAADATVPVAVTPEWAIAEPGYRLTGAFPGPEAGLDCPASLCLRAGGRRLYGARADQIPELGARERRLYVLDRFGTLSLPCLNVLEEGTAKLWLCSSMERER